MLAPRGRRAGGGRYASARRPRRAGPPGRVGGGGPPTRAVVGGPRSPADPGRWRAGYDGGMDRIAARLRLPTWAQDTVFALFVAFFQVAGTRHVAPSHEVARLAHLADLGYLLLAVAGLALLARRRWPMGVFATTAAISLVYYTAGYPDGPGWIALFIAAYTVTARGDGQRSVQIVGATIVLLTVVWLLTADLTPIDAAGWVFFRIGTAITAVVLGDMLRARRVVAAEALERAERAERTREEEARRRVDAERLRIAREVHDTVAHAIAVINVQAGVTVSIRYGPSDLEVRVADDGRGPCEGAGPAGGGRGIVGMRERAALLSGELAAGPGPDGGFQVWARLPLEPEGAAPG